MKTLILMFRLQPTSGPYDPNRIDSFPDYLLPLGLPYISAVLKRAVQKKASFSHGVENGIIFQIYQFHQEG